MRVARAVGLIVFVLVAAAAAMPARRDVVGLSMAPGLMPGDRVTSGAFPLADRWRVPVPNERWVVVAPDGSEAVKRVAACGPGTLAIVDGDLEVDGRILPPPPPVLLERMTVVREYGWEAEGRWQRELSDGSDILDDAAFAPDERRVLMPVKDLGACVIARVVDRSPSSPMERVVIGVGERAVAWRPTRAGSFAFLAGAVDRHLVAAAWRIPRGDDESGIDRRQIEIAAPVRWSVVEPFGPRKESPGLTLSHVGGPAGRVTIERVRIWRDVLERPAADGTTAWRLDADEVFLLGDFPSGSVDSRQWGPLTRRAMRFRVRSAAMP